MRILGYLSFKKTIEGLYLLLLFFFGVDWEVYEFSKK